MVIFKYLKATAKSMGILHTTEIFPLHKKRRKSAFKMNLMNVAIDLCLMLQIKNNFRLNNEKPIHSIAVNR